MRKIIFILNLCFTILLVKAQVVLPSVFADDMVLQQQSDVSIWGKANPNTKIEVIPSWDKKKYSVKVNQDSTWIIKIQTPKASFSNYEIIIRSGKYSRRIKNIAIGEVWLCSGQSNMEMPMKGYPNQPVQNSLNDIVISSNKYLRTYNVKKTSSIYPRSDTNGNWLIASPETTSEFSATAYYFGRLLQQVLQVPIGLLHSSWGGSRIEAWMSPEAIRNFLSYTIPRNEFDNKIKNKSPTVLYNGMLYSILGYGIRGAIWYQGEANRLDYKNYPELFEAMHKDWIGKWNIGEFPIYFCQIAPNKYSGNDNSAFMREAQLKIAQKQKNTGIAILMDVGEEFCIHPSNKKQVGERLAYNAVGQTYGFSVFPFQSPEYSSIKINSNKIIIEFKYAPIGLTTLGNQLVGFELAGEDRIFYSADAKIIKNTVEVSSNLVTKPIAVRYGFNDYFNGCLFGVNGLPVSSFRSDEWDLVK